MVHDTHYFKVVERTSSTLGLPDTRERVIALDADHETLCRFASEDDEGYKHVSALIVDLASAAVNSKPCAEVSRQESFCSSGSTLVKSPMAEPAKEGFCKFIRIGS